jgi:hypothetical protein
VKLRRVGIQNTAVGRDRLWSGVIVSPTRRRLSASALAVNDRVTILSLAVEIIIILIVSLLDQHQSIHSPGYVELGTYHNLS